MPIESRPFSQPKKPCFTLFLYQVCLLYTGDSMLKEKNNAMMIVKHDKENFIQGWVLSW